jgi:hypothetical protein
MKKLGWHQWLLLIVFLLAVFVTGLFAVRAVRRAVYWQTHRDEPIRPWMSVRYVSLSYGVPPHVLYEALRLEPVPHDRRPLRQIAREQNRSVEALIQELQEAIKGFRAHAPPEPPPPKPFTSPGAGATP